MDHFWLVPNGICFHTTKVSGYKDWISDIWTVRNGSISIYMYHAYLDVVGLEI